MNLFKRRSDARTSLDAFARTGSATSIDDSIDRITGGLMALCHNGGGGGGNTLRDYNVGPIGPWNNASSGLNIQSAVSAGFARP